MEIIKLNLIPSGVNPTCHCSQYDNGRVIRIELFDGLTPYTLQSGDTVTLNVRKPDNTIVTASVTATQGNNYVDIVTTEQICACVGYNLCDLTITNGSVVIGTLNFIMAIERDVLADGIESQSVIEDLDELVSEAVAEDLGDNYYTKSQVDTALNTKANASEVEDIRIGADGITYSSAGNAVRGQLSSLVNGGVLQYTKAILHSIGAVYSNVGIKADSDDIGKNIVDDLLLNSYRSMVYKIDISNASTVLLPMYKTAASNGSVLTDENGIVLKGVFNKTDDAGTIYTLDCSDSRAKWLYFGTNAVLEDMDFTVTVNLNKITDKVNSKLDNVIENNDLVLTESLSVKWLQGNVSPNGYIVDSTTRCHTKPLIINNAFDYIRVSFSNMKLRVSFYNSYSVRNITTLIATDSNTNWTNNELIVKYPTGAKSYMVSVAYQNDATITPSDCSVVQVELVNNLYEDEFKNKVISILGDSISTFAGNDPETDADGHTIADGTYTYAGNHCRYPNAYLSDVNDTYWKKLIDSLRLKLGINDSWAGSRVSWNGQEGSDYGANKYIASQTRINHLDDNGTPDIILVNAGTNDIGLNVTVGTFNTESPINYTAEQIAALPVATFADAYRALLIRLQKTYPLARVVVMLPNYTTSYYNPTNADLYLEVIKEACDYFGVPYIDMRTTGITMYNVSTYTGDGIHPNIKGMSLLYQKLLKFFKFSL